MPCLGLTSLHKVSFWLLWSIIWCVNALSRAHVSAPTATHNGKEISYLVSMPCLGLTSLHLILIPI